MLAGLGRELARDLLRQSSLARDKLGSRVHARADRRSKKGGSRLSSKARSNARNLEQVLSLTFPLEPVPKKRARFDSRRGGAYADERGKDFETQIAILARQALGGMGPVDGALVCSIEFQFPHLMRARRRKVDVDNLCKAVCDGLNGVVWRDDSQIVALAGWKRFGDSAHVKVWVERVLGDWDFELVTNRLKSAVVLAENRRR